MSINPSKERAFVAQSSSILLSSMTMQDIYETSVNAHPNQTAVIYFDEAGKKRSYSYAQYKSQTFVIASKLSSALSAIPSGSIIGLKIKNCPSWGHFFWAILMTGHVPLLLDARLAHDNTENLLAQSKAKAIIVNEEDSYSIASFRLNDVQSQETDYQFAANWADNVIFCSSGTTGDAKMIVYSGANLCHQLDASEEMYKDNFDIIYPGKIRILAMIPLHHIFGFVAVFLWYTFYGAAIVYPTSLSSADILAAVKKAKVTHLYSVPLFWDSLAQRVNREATLTGGTKGAFFTKMIAYHTKQISKKEAGLASVGLLGDFFKSKLLGKQIRYCISGGGYLSPKTLNTINGCGYSLHNGFGMTEVGVTSVDLSSSIEERLKGSIGRPLHGVSYKIAPIEGSADGSGELLIKSAIVPSTHIIGGIRHKVSFEDGYFRTGDIVTVDASGSYYVRGRIKDTIINANGENVYPDEIEFYFRNVKHVVRCVVFGVKRKGSDEEKITLVLEIDNAIKGEEIGKLKSDLKAINDILPNEKKVQDILIYKRAIPLANGIKVKRYFIKEALEKGDDDFLSLGEERKQATFKGYDQSEVQQVVGEVTKIFSKILVLPDFKIGGDAHWIDDLGGDSMSYVEMVGIIDKTFKITVPEEKYGVLTCVDDFAEEVLILQTLKKTKQK